MAVKIHQTKPTREKTLMIPQKKKERKDSKYSNKFN